MGEPAPTSAYEFGASKAGLLQVGHCLWISPAHVTHMEWDHDVLVIQMLWEPRKYRVRHDPGGTGIDASMIERIIKQAQIADRTPYKGKGLPLYTIDGKLCPDLPDAVNAKGYPSAGGRRLYTAGHLKRRGIPVQE